MKINRCTQSIFILLFACISHHRSAAIQSHILGECSYATAINLDNTVMAQLLGTWSVSKITPNRLNIKNGLPHENTCGPFSSDEGCGAMFLTFSLSNEGKLRSETRAYNLKTNDSVFYGISLKTLNHKLAIFRGSLQETGIFYNEEAGKIDFDRLQLTDTAEKLYGQKFAIVYMHSDGGFAILQTCDGKITWVMLAHMTVKKNLQNSYTTEISKKLKALKVKETSLVDLPLKCPFSGSETTTPSQKKCTNVQAARVNEGVLALMQDKWRVVFVTSNDGSKRKSTSCFVFSFNNNCGDIAMKFSISGDQLMVDSEMFTSETVLHLVDKNYVVFDGKFHETESMVIEGKIKSEPRGKAQDHEFALLELDPSGSFLIFQTCDKNVTWVLVNEAIVKADLQREFKQKIKIILKLLNVKMDNLIDVPTSKMARTKANEE